MKDFEENLIKNASLGKNEKNFFTSEYIDCRRFLQKNPRYSNLSFKDTPWVLGFSVSW